MAPAIKTKKDALWISEVTWLTSKATSLTTTERSCLKKQCLRTMERSLKSTEPVCYVLTLLLLCQDSCLRSSVVINQSMALEEMTPAPTTLLMKDLRITMVTPQSIARWRTHQPITIWLTSVSIQKVITIQLVKKMMMKRVVNIWRQVTSVNRMIPPFWFKRRNKSLRRRKRRQSLLPLSSWSPLTGRRTWLAPTVVWLVEKSVVLASSTRKIDLKTVRSLESQQPMSPKFVHSLMSLQRQLETSQQDKTNQLYYHEARE